MEENISGRAAIRKYLITILCAILVLFSTNTAINAFAEYDEISDIKNELLDYGIVNADILESETISRGQCLSSIMRLIGLNDECAAQYANRLFEYLIFYDVPNKGHAEEGYIIMAGFEKIAYGVSMPKSSGVNFYADNKVTLKECIAFIVRCLDENVSDINETYTYAINKGIIKDTDSFWEKENEHITPNDLCVLLNRMLYEKRGKYYEKEEIEYELEDEKGVYTTYNPNYDNAKELRYIDQFAQQQ